MVKMQEALDEVQTTHIKEVDEMNEQLERQRERSEELTEAVSICKHFPLLNGNENILLLLVKKGFTCLSVLSIYSLVPFLVIT